jgi:hypothetical protein
VAREKRRVYSLQVLCSVVAALFVLRYLEHRRGRDLVGFGLLSVLNIYVHFVGMMITALLFVPLMVDAWLETRRRRRERSNDGWQSLVPIVVAGAAIALLVLPQLVRLLSLIGHGAPWRAEVSLPGLSPRFLNRVSWFWFVNADWGSLRPADQLVTAVYVGSITVLAVAGLAAVPRRAGATAALWIVFPLVGIGLAATRMDVRDRYFVWTLPLLWVAVATGGLGALPSNRLKGASGDIARGFRGALVVAVAAGSLWLLWHKLPERYPQWTKLMTGIAEIYRPSMMVYMPLRSAIGSPRLLATELQVPAGLRDIRDLSPATHDQFVKEVERGQDFVFLLYGNLQNDEMRWRVRYLEQQQYRKTVVPVYGASAQIFTRGEVEGLWQNERIAADPSPPAMVAWARQQLQNRSATSANASPLAQAVVARVGEDGVVRKGRLFTSQYGENGSWKLGPQDWDGVEETRTTSGRVARDVIAAHPASTSVLVVAFPAQPMKTSLGLLYGISDTGLVFRAGANVDVTVYVNGEEKIATSCPNTPGWKELAADTANLDGKPADVVMLITTANDAARHFAFRLEPSPKPARALDAATAAGPVVLTGGRRLREFVDRLRVYRLEGDRRSDAQSDGRAYSAEEMHEATGSVGEGAVRRRWALGPLPWDGVGVTRQRSGGDLRDGLWAHPRNGTTLVIDVPGVTLGQVLRGHFGLTDYAVANAKAAGVTAPVTLKMFVDGRPVFEQAAARTAGWTPLAIPVDGENRAHALRIEISSERDSWAHFIFDLWSD